MFLLNKKNNFSILRFSILFCFIFLLSYYLELDNINATENSGIIELSSPLRDMAFNIFNNEIVGISTQGSFLEKIDATTNKMINLTNLPFQPLAIATYPIGSAVYILAPEPNTPNSKIYVYNNGQPTSSILLNGKALSMAFNQDTSKLYITFPDKILLIDPKTQQSIAVIPSNQSQGKIIFNSYDNNMYVLNRNSDTVSKINTQFNFISDIIPVGDSLFDIAFNPINKMVYVTSGEPSSVYIIDPEKNKVIEKINIGKSDTNLLVFNPVDKNMYVFSQYFIYVIDSFTHMISEILPLNVPHGIDAILFNPFNKLIYMATSEPNLILYKYFNSKS